MEYSTYSMEEKVKIEEKNKEEVKAVVKQDPFSLIGKVAVAAIILAVLIGGGIFLGMNLSKNKAQTNNSAIPSPLPTTSIQASPTVSSNSGQVISPTLPPGSQGTRTITAGGGTGSSFGVYAIDIPVGWTDVTTKTDITNKLTVSRGDYSLSVYQAPIGGGGCVYPGDPSSVMAQSFTDFVQITGAHKMLRRSWNKTGSPANTISYTVCEENGSSFGSPTSFGAVSVKSPDPVDAAVMKDIDFMLSSLAEK